MDDNPAIREGYADDWEGEDWPDSSSVNRLPKPHHLKAWQKPVRGIPSAANLNTQQIPPVVERYHTNGPDIPQRDLELSKIEKQVEDIRAILKRGGVRPANLAESEIKSALFKIELSTSYLKEHPHG